MINKICDDFALFKNTSLFSNINYLNFYEGTIYSTKYCPYIFNNANISMLFLYRLFDNLVKSNYPSFYETNTTINSSIELLLMHVYYLKLDNNIISESVFKKTKYLSITGIIESIHKEAFKNFHLEYIHLRLYHLHEFLYKGFEYLSVINSDLDLKNETEIENYLKLKKNRTVIVGFEILSKQFESEEIFKDEDICLFDKFPHNRLIFPTVIPNVFKTLHCTCSLLWFMRYKSIYSKFYKMSDDPINLDIKGLDILSNYRRFSLPYFCAKSDICNFTDQLQKCHGNELRNHSIEHKDYEYDVDYYLLIFQYISQAILSPLFSILGIMINVISIKVLKNKQFQSELRKSFFKYAQINCHFNLIYCFITILKLFNRCIITASGKYCPLYVINPTVQYFDILVFKYFLSVMRFNCCATELSISYSRLVNIMEIKNFFTSFTSKVSIRLYLVILFIVSMLMNLVKFVYAYYYLNNIVVMILIILLDFILLVKVKLQNRPKLRILKKKKTRLILKIKS